MWFLPERKSLDRLLRLLKDEGPLSLDAIVAGLERRERDGREGSEADRPLARRAAPMERARQQRGWRHRIYALLRADGALVRNGIVSIDPAGRYVLSDKGTRLADDKSVVARPLGERLGARLGIAMMLPAGLATAGGGAGLQAAEAAASSPRLTAPSRDAAADVDADVDAMDAPPAGAPPRFWRAPLRWLAWRWRRPTPAWRRWVQAFAMATVAVICVALVRELKSSDIQSWYFSNLASTLTYRVEPGTSAAIRFPESGPFDERLGYARLPVLLERAQTRGFRLASQARLSPAHLALVEHGIYPIYREKAQAGLSILDTAGKPLFKSLYPQLIYGRFEDIPDVVVKTLLFIENRELLDDSYPHKNPTIEWDRLGLAMMDMVLSKIIPGHEVPGGSTLATQLEKYRHSPDGRTTDVSHKAVQMASATIRAYLEGRDTGAARRRIVTDYINSVPLGAMPGAGEIRGIGHGLAAWHGASFDEVNELLRDAATPEPDPERLAAKARAFKEVLSLFLSQRRPAFYLQSNREALKGLTQKHLGPLERAGIITPEFRAAVAKADLGFRNNMLMFQPERLSFVERKAANAVRVHLLQLFGFDRLYTLDRMDLTVTSTIDYDTQAEVTKLLQQLKDPAFAATVGLNADRLLGRGDPKDVIYSFMLRERVGDANVLRVQADNVDGPFNVSEGGKLELGSTAKLRTVVCYLQVIEDLWRLYADASPAQLRAVKAPPGDRLTAWALAHFGIATDKSLPATLEAAMSRPYSANPNEVFFTGGGAHRFNNFEKEDNGRVVDVHEALRKSINLPFVRMMRELAGYYTAKIPGTVRMMEDRTDPLRKEYLTRFANKEGKEFLSHFYLRYRGQAAPTMLKTLLAHMRNLSSRKLAAVYTTLHPEAVARDEGDFEDFKRFVQAHLPDPERATDKHMAAVLADLRKDDYSLQDKGYIAGVHPLELWLVSFLYKAPDASFSQVVGASVNERQDAYAWLFNSRNKDKQDRRIKIMLEQEAFQGIHARWQELGYPFGSLVASYATALGSSGDKPAALAELMGIIQNDGIRYASVRIDEMRFAEGTPFETTLVGDHRNGKRVLSADIAGVVKSALRSVVEDGTARRVKGAFVMPNGESLVIGGKTGTGDNRYAIYAPGGRVIESKVMSRTATFVFYIGDRFFGTLTAYVPTVNAGTYNFTSALPVQILKTLAPKLMPLIARRTVAH